MKMKLIVGLVVLSTVVIGLVLYNSGDEPASEQSEATVQSYTLSNGMKVLVVENHRAPVVVSQVWYKVGASYEHDGITGVSHVLEHMMFKGTEKHPAGEFSEIVAANGGEENAFTGQDYTAYFQKIANDRLELCLELEADRMRNLVFSEKEFLKEIEVVKEERRMRTDDKPTALTYERFNAVAYTNSPYRRPIVGWMEDLDTLTVEDARLWYKTWYAPNNATLVVAGDVQAEDVFQLAKQYFGQLPTSKIPQLKPRREAKQFGTQRVSVEVPAKIPYLIMGYKAPVLRRNVNDITVAMEGEWEVYALEVLAGVLDGGSSARLSDNLVRGQQIANSASAGYGMTSRHETLFTLSAVPNDNVAIEVLEFALREEINIIKTQLPDDAELQRVKAQVVAAQVYQKDSTFYAAMEIGMLDTIGLPWQIKDEYVDKILAVTAEQVQQVANKYLTDERLTVAVLEPLPINGVEEKSEQEMNATAGGVDDAQ
ncbi:FIG015547: peptidase, M16 family [hydrothermal vent metagenome]|uniref:FIG015547: peptidase, M16 family n=1 Tax=hydrothermal vent metagenome TaxID=652676 RepID=A0A3B0XHZ9_9ZZZZ